MWMWNIVHIALLLFLYLIFLNIFKINKNKFLVHYLQMLLGGSRCLLQLITQIMMHVDTKWPMSQQTWLKRHLLPRHQLLVTGLIASLASAKSLKREDLVNAQVTGALSVGPCHSCVIVEPNNAHSVEGQERARALLRSAVTRLVPLSRALSQPRTGRWRIRTDINYTGHLIQQI